jgi:hypothetical protein
MNRSGQPLQQAFEQVGYGLGKKLILGKSLNHGDTLQSQLSSHPEQIKIAK